MFFTKVMNNNFLLETVLTDYPSFSFSFTVKLECHSKTRMSQ